MPNNTSVIVLTREPADNDSLKRLLVPLGMEVAEYPCVCSRLLPLASWHLPDDRPLSEYRFLAFTSRRAVRATAAIADEISSGPAGLAAVGQGTADELERTTGRRAEIVASPPTGAGLAQALLARLLPGERVLHLRGDRSTGTLREGLARGGHQLAELEVYENPEPEIEPLCIPGPGLVVLASPSAARRYLAANRDRDPNRDTFLVIGPTTAEWLRKRTPRPIRVAEEPSNEGLADLIGRVASEGSEDDT